MTYAILGMNLKSVMLSDIILDTRDNVYMILLICNDPKAKFAASETRLVVS